MSRLQDKNFTPRLEASAQVLLSGVVTRTFCAWALQKGITTNQLPVPDAHRQALTHAFRILQVWDQLWSAGHMAGFRAGGDVKHTVPTPESDRRRPHPQSQC